MAKGWKFSHPIFRWNFNGYSDFLAKGWHFFNWKNIFCKCIYLWIEKTSPRQRKNTFNASDCNGLRWVTFLCENFTLVKTVVNYSNYTDIMLLSKLWPNITEIRITLADSLRVGIMPWTVTRCNSGARLVTSDVFFLIIIIHSATLLSGKGRVGQGARPFSLQ